MQGGLKRSRTGRIVITSITTTCLFILPLTSIPDGILFLVPGIAEAAAFLFVIIWSELKGQNIRKKAEAQKTELLSTIENSIESLNLELSKTKDQKIKAAIKKELEELYRERNQERATHRKKLRDNISKLEEDEKSCKLESETARDQLTQRAEQELEKITEESKANQSNTQNTT